MPAQCSGAALPFTCVSSNFRNIEPKPLPRIRCERLLHCMNELCQYKPFIS